MAGFIVNVYADLVKKREISIDQVPENLRDAVWSIAKYYYFTSEGVAIDVSKMSSRQRNLLIADIRARAEAGEDIKTIINGLYLTDEEKWQLEADVKEG